MPAYSIEGEGVQINKPKLAGGTPIFGLNGITVLVLTTTGEFARVALSPADRATLASQGMSLDGDNKIVVV